MVMEVPLLVASLEGQPSRGVPESEALAEYDVISRYLVQDALHDSARPRRSPSDRVVEVCSRQGELARRRRAIARVPEYLVHCVAIGVDDRFHSNVHVVCSFDWLNYYLGPYLSSSSRSSVW